MPDHDTPDRPHRIPPERADRFRALVDRIPAIVYIETQERPFPTVYVSKRIEDVLGWPRDLFLEGQSFWASLVHPDDLDAAVEVDDKSNQTLEPFVVEYRLRDTDGAWHWFHDEAELVPAGDPSGYWLGIMVDITEHKSDEALGRITAAERNARTERAVAEAGSFRPGLTEPPVV